MSVRLVKGAYWDSEIKRAQERGLASFPVYTSKAATDASYLQCVQVLFAARDAIYPQFATHNAYTVAAVLALAPPGAAYEFQRLHGMGEALYAAARAELPQLPPVRVYAPVGSHEDLLPYLVRRLLENGANSSFVHQFLNPDMPVEEVVRDPRSTRSSAERAGAGAASASRRALYGARARQLSAARTSATRQRSRASSRRCARTPRRPTAAARCSTASAAARRGRAGELTSRHARMSSATRAMPRRRRSPRPWSAAAAAQPAWEAHPGAASAPRAWSAPPMRSSRAAGNS